MQDSTADLQDYSIYGQPIRQPRFWRPGALTLSLIIALLTSGISGTVIADHLAQLPNVDGLFHPRLVQTTPVPTQNAYRQNERMSVLDTNSGLAEIDVAPTAPVSVQPYPLVAEASIEVPASKPAFLLATDQDQAADETSLPAANSAEAAAFHKDHALAERLAD